MRSPSSRALLLCWLVTTASLRPPPLRNVRPARGVQPPPADDARPTSSRREFLALGAAAALGLASAPRAAEASGLGPSVGAVLSQPPVKLLDVEEWLALDPKKQAQRIGSLGAQRSQELVKAFEKMEYAGADVIDGLITELEKVAPTPETKAELEKLQAMRLDNRKGRQVQQMIRDRSILMDKLEAQPDWVPYGAAVLASFGSTCVMHPVDTLKTLKMAGGAEAPTGRGTKAKAKGKSGSGKSGKAAGAGATLAESASSLLPLAEVEAAGGIGALYSGLTANLLKEGPPSALYLGIYETVKTQLLAKGGVLTLPPLAAYLVAGAVGEAVGSIVRAPSEAAKTRVQSGLAESTQEAFVQLLASPAATLTTWSTSLVRDVPFGALQIAIFEGTKTFILQSKNIDIDINTIYAEAALGGLGGLVGALASAPADVLVTRLITQGEAGEGERLGALEMAKKIYDENGLAGFWAGAGARVAYWTPAIAIFLSLYCTLRKAGLELLPM